MAEVHSKPESKAVRDKIQRESQDIPGYQFVIGGRGTISRSRARLAIVLSDILNLVYYRVWFSRIAPRFGIPLRPLWKRWIRSRF